MTGQADTAQPERATIHGTYAGWNKHQQTGTPPCQPCTDARNAYTRNRRASNPQAREKNRAWNRTRAAALERLAREYPARFTEILSELRAQATERP